MKKAKRSQANTPTDLLAIDYHPDAKKLVRMAKTILKKRGDTNAERHASDTLHHVGTAKIIRFKNGSKLLMPGSAFTTTGKAPTRPVIKRGGGKFRCFAGCEIKEPHKHCRECWGIGHVASECTEVLG